MKSRTSFFDGAIYKKNMTRFAPLWVLYTICLVMGMFLLYSDSVTPYSTVPYRFQENLAQLMPMMTIINFVGALIAVQLLFGDLYQSRMCNAIHALPVTRDSLFGSHVAAGLSFSLLPTLVGTVVASLMSIGTPVTNGWQIPLWWLLETNLQYLFFFALGVFCALWVGNRLAQAMLYGLTNFGAMIVAWLVDTLYTPLLYGIQANVDPFLMATPAVKFAGANYLRVYREYDYSKDTYIDAWFEMEDGWGYLAICAGLGLLMLFAAWQLYRRRQLECAGDFLAVKKLEPVFAAVLSLTVAALFYAVCDELYYVQEMAVPYMLIGLVIGLLAAQMLLERTIRVLNKVTLKRFVIILGCFGLSLLLTVVDIFGLENRIPDGEQIKSVIIQTNHSTYINNALILDEPEEIADILRVHEIALEERQYEGMGSYTTEDDEEYVNIQPIGIHYTLKNGKTMSRYYSVVVNGEAGDILIPHFNTFEAVFAGYPGDMSRAGIEKATQYVDVECWEYVGTGYEGVAGNNVVVTMKHPEDIQGLLDAIAADCAAGTMAQQWDFRPDPRVDVAYWLNFDLGDWNASVTVFTDCVNTCRFLTELGFISSDLDYYEEFGGPIATFVTE